jgi:hypothetical protein
MREQASFKSSLSPNRSKSSGLVSGLVSDDTGSVWLAIPSILINFGGAAVCLMLITLWMKGDVYTELPWWVVLLPAIIALGVFFIVFSSAIFGWIYTAVMLMTGNAEVDIDREVRIDGLFRTAKVCFLGHGYVQLLMLSLGLLVLKLSVWPNLPMAYPLLPIIVLGCVYIFLAVLLREPEVDSTWYSIVGMTLLSQSVMLIVKLDHYQDSKQLPWAATFTPAWLTYVILLVYCVISPIQAGSEDVADEHSRSAGSAQAPYGSMNLHDNVPEGGRLRAQLQKVAGIGGWVIGWGAAQVFLTLRLDGLHKMSWLGVLLPALLGWLCLLFFLLLNLSAHTSGTLFRCSLTR